MHDLVVGCSCLHNPHPPQKSVNERKKECDAVLCKYSDTSLKAIPKILDTEGSNIPAKYLLTV
jgi:hypothetical protein